jgi:hypothetical protein
MKGPPKPRGRPPKKPPPTPRGIYVALKPRFEAYRCEWAGCPAELHNMATLRTHVLKVHGGQEHCMWSSCAHKNAVATVAPAEPGEGRGTGGQERAGSDASDVLTTDLLLDHIETKHLVPIQWLRGDGYNTGPISPTKTTTTATYEIDPDPPPIPSYLLDKDGKQVTPWVWYQEVEDNATRLARKKRLRQVLMQMNEEAPSEEEEFAEGDAMEVS